MVSPAAVTALGVLVCSLPLLAREAQGPRGLELLAVVGALPLALCALVAHAGAVYLVARAARFLGGGYWGSVVAGLAYGLYPSVWAFGVRPDSVAFSNLAVAGMLFACSAAARGWSKRAVARVISAVGGLLLVLCAHGYFEGGLGSAEGGSALGVFLPEWLGSWTLLVPLALLGLLQLWWRRGTRWGLASVAVLGAVFALLAATHRQWEPWVMEEEFSRAHGPALLVCSILAGVAFEWLRSSEEMGNLRLPLGLLTGAALVFLVFTGWGRVGAAGDNSIEVFRRGIEEAVLRLPAGVCFSPGSRLEGLLAPPTREGPCPGGYAGTRFSAVAGAAAGGAPELRGFLYVPGPAGSGPTSLETVEAAVRLCPLLGEVRAVLPVLGHAYSRWPWAVFQRVFHGAAEYLFAHAYSEEGHEFSAAADAIGHHERGSSWTHRCERLARLKSRILDLKSQQP